MLNIKKISGNNALDILSIKSAAFSTLQGFLCRNEPSSQVTLSVFEILLRVITLLPWCSSSLCPIKEVTSWLLEWNVTFSSDDDFVLAEAVPFREKEGKQLPDEPIIKF